MIISIQDRLVGEDQPTYFIADIGANHDGDIRRAKQLISLAKQAGADAAKFQHFKADKIVSDYGFRKMKTLSHQAKWNKSVFETYQDAELNRTWNKELATHCQKEGIHFFSSPYDFEAVEMLDPYMPAYKIGSGDVNWDEIIILMAKKGKPVLLATGASDLQEVVHAVETVIKYNKHLVLMQCNTNYTGDMENFRYINLRVLQTYRTLFPEVILGLSDHTLGHATVLGAVALGARVIEKHFTDDNSRVGPDHAFAMNPHTWREMVERTRELESALGSPIKRVEQNEEDTVIVQRRCIRVTRSIPKGQTIKADDLEVLRPAPLDSFPPNKISLVVGKKATRNLEAGEHLNWEAIC
ncbi:N-acetylneuraminate synthase family protein [Patescibacteria group bacterium]|nr:N-acetylneuraminate synthase family protein [Patescibacteria group bacterium]